MTAEERRLERFTRLWDVDGHGSCFEWQGYVDPGGYGRFYWSVERPTVLAHRASWEMRFGPIPDGFQVCHHCDNRKCVRPGHLFLGTQRDNIQDAIVKGRRADPGPTCKRGHPRSEYRPNGKGRTRCQRCQLDLRKVRKIDLELDVPWPVTS